MSLLATPSTPGAYAPAIREMLDDNPIVGELRTGSKRFWTGREIKLLRQHYPLGGVPACLPELTGRTASAIYNRANMEGLGAPASAKHDFRRQRWTKSEAIDAVIRRAYQATPTKGDIQRCAKAVGRPRWWVSRRATAMGLVVPRFKGLPWTEAENELIQSAAHRDPTTIRRMLTSKGFARTETAITVQLKRLGANCEDPDHFTACGLGKVMGVDSHVIAGWIGKGWLRAKRRGTERVAEQGGDQWWIHRRDVRAFIVENVAAVDLRKVDKFWFIDLLAGAA